MSDAQPHDNAVYAALWSELSGYLGFTAAHADALRALRPVLEPSFAEIVDAFYAAIERTPEAKATFRGGSAQIERQKGFLSQWLHEVFEGVYDEAYVARHARIGRTHVRIGLQQRYMVSAMGVVRHGLHRALGELADCPVEPALARTAIDLMCELEMAVMLETYSEHYIAQMRAKERLATLGQIAGFVGHELRNPLAVMETSLHLLKRHLGEADNRTERHLSRLSRQVSLSSGIIAGLMELTRDRQPEREQVSLREAIEQAIAGLAEHELAQFEIDVDAEANRPRVDPSHLRHLLVNLLSNAVQAMNESGPGGRVWVRGRVQGDALVLDVEDEGPGLDESFLHELFEPLRTTREKGLGLGLALCRKIAEKHGGQITAENREGGGARFIVRLAQAFGDKS